MRGLLSLGRGAPPARAAYRFPFPPFPVGWYVLGEAASFPHGAVATLHRFGRDIVVFRTEGGEVAALDAPCPHLGAHLGGGVVRGEQIVCPFHGFGFGADGRCASLPAGYGSKVPPRLACHTWPVRRVSGMLAVWFEPAGGAPRWEIPEPDHAGWRPIRWRNWQVRTHPQETGEGSVDLGHLRAVHRYLTAEPTSALETDGPRLRARYRVTRHAIAGLPGRVITLDIAPELHGLGFSRVDVHIVELDLRFRLWVLATPVDGEVVDYRVGLSMQEPARPAALHPLLDYVPRSLLAPVVERLSFHAFAGDVELDFGIWESKAYVHPPALVAGDGPIGAYRRWARQFYSESAAAVLGGGDGLAAAS